LARGQVQTAPRTRRCQRYYRTVYAALRENAPLAVPPTLSRQVVAILEGTLRSAATRTVVRL
jgi:hypothetical protein